MASIINATTTGLTVTPDNSGQLTLSANGSTALTANTTGYLNFANQPTIGGVQWPAFGAYNSSATSLGSGAYTKVLFATEEFDTNNNFASSRFTPTVAGYYQLNAAVSIAGGGGAAEINPVIYKNGSQFKAGSDGGTASFRATVSALVYANGSSDYFEIYCYSGAARTTEATDSATYFNGVMVRSA